ncbi:MAG TPA: helix-turn-helix domain-containing protein [Armatimonadetes bacterium]|jgi:transcriptional regulator with XRE-family HTH domain|nr:helix-turn-helix domain-containing protein [Armatimonadota bacterium]
MAGTLQIGPVVRRLRERWRLTQQDVVEYARLERSSSYISSIETGKTSPTLAELEALAVVFRTTLFEMIREAGGGTDEGAPAHDLTPQLNALFRELSTEDQELALEILRLLARRQKSTDA